jgi:Ca2+-binding RTX toxin-like protein
MTRILHRLPSSLSIGFAVLLVLAARPAAAVDTGTLVIEAHDQDGNPIPGGCYNVLGKIGSFGPFCDDGGDGQVVLVDVTPGFYEVWEESPPDGYQSTTTPSQAVQVDLDETETVVFVNEPLPPNGSIVVLSEDQDGNPLPDGCYAVEGPDLPGPVCDNDAGDADSSPGVVEFQGLLPGGWWVFETQAPQGYQPAVGQAVDLAAGETEPVTFEHFPIEDSADSIDPDFEPVARPTAETFELVAVTPPPRIFLAPSCAGLPATIVGATSAGGVPTKIVGTSGNDVIVGTAGPDLINGLGGHDMICSLDGADAIQGGDGDDWIAAGPGDDALAGGVGRDHLDGGAGKRDACDGGSEQDTAVNCESTVAVP